MQGTYFAIELAEVLLREFSLGRVQLRELFEHRWTRHGFYLCGDSSDVVTNVMKEGGCHSAGSRRVENLTKSARLICSLKSEGTGDGGHFICLLDDPHHTIYITT